MRKAIYILLLFISIFSFQSCSNSSSVEDVAIKVTTHLINQEYDNFFKYLERPDGISDSEFEIYKSKVMKKAAEDFTDPSEELYQIMENGGMTKLNIIPQDGKNVRYYDIYINDTIIENARASIDFEVVCKNGKIVSPFSMGLEKINNEWKIAYIDKIK